MPDMVYGFQGAYRFLSNFYEVEEGIVYRGMFAHTTEHLFQAMKTSDIPERGVVLSADTPGESKKAGRMVTLRPEWDQVKLSVMSDLVEAKFSVGRLSSMLLSTQDWDLIEANNWHDTFWGVCICEKHNGRGENWLGLILQIQRSRLYL